MADRYWVGGTAAWDGTAGSKWATSSGGAGGEAEPTSSDDVYFDGNSGAVTVTITTAVCNTFTTTGFIGSFSGTGTLAIYGSVVLGADSSMLSYTGTITFSATATGKTITTNAVKVVASIAWAGTGGGWTLQDAWDSNSNSNGSWTLTAGAIDTNGKAVQIAGFVTTGSTTRSLTLGASTITIRENGSWLASSSLTNFTLTVNTSTITMSGAFDFFGNGLTYYNAGFSASNTSTLRGANTFNNLTINGGNSASLALHANQTVTGTYAGSGTNAYQRFQITSDTFGTQRTITAATVGVVTNVDFRDIVGAGAGSWDLSAAIVGDMEGNSGITFTAAATFYWFSNTGDISDATKWFTATGGGGAAGRVPLPQDTARFDSGSFTAAGHTVTFDVSAMRFGAIDATGVTNDPTFTGTLTLFFIGAITIPSGPTISGGSTWTFLNRSSRTLSIAPTCDKSLTFSGTGGITLGASLTIGSTRTLSLTRGTTDANDFDVSLGFFSMSGATTLNMGNGDWTLTGNAGTIWSVLFSVTAVNPEGSTVTANYAGGTGTRTIAQSKASTAVPFYITGGTDTVSLSSSIFGLLDLTGFAGTLAGAGPLTITSSAGTVAPYLKLSTGLTLTFTGDVTISGTQNATLTSNGKSWASAFTFSLTGTLTPADALTTTGAVTQQAGTFVTADLAMNSASYSATTSANRTLDIGSSTWTLTGTGTVWSIANGGTFTIITTGSTIKVTDSSASAKTFAGGSKVYDDLWYAPAAGTGTFTITGSNTFADLRDDGTAAHSFLFTSGTTTTLDTWSITGNPGQFITIGSTSSNEHTLSKTNNDIVTGVDYLSISRSQAHPDSDVWYAGSNSIDGGDNDGWIFADAPTPPPPGATVSNRMMMWIGT